MPGIDHCHLVVNAADFQVQSQCCCLSGAVGRRKSPPLLLIWAGLLGNRELIQEGSAAERQLCPGAALLHSTAGLGNELQVS